MTLFKDTRRQSCRQGPCPVGGCVAGATGSQTAVPQMPTTRERTLDDVMIDTRTQVGQSVWVAEEHGSGDRCEDSELLALFGAIAGRDRAESARRLESSVQL